MSDSCCQNKGCKLTTLKKDQTQVLWAVLAINLVYASPQDEQL